MSPLLVLLFVACSSRPDGVIDVYVASSLHGVLEEAAALYQREHGVTVRLNSAASSVLARQIGAGAPADVFLSAHPRWSAYLREQRHEALTGYGFAATSLVLARHVDRGSWADLAAFAADAGARLAVADPAHVPLGWYSIQVLERRGCKAALADRILTTENAAQTRRLLQRGEVDAAFLYAADVVQSEHLVVTERFGAADHDAVRYEVLCLNQTGATIAFINFLRGPAVAALLQRRGFLPVTGALADAASGK